MSWILSSASVKLKVINLRIFYPKFFASVRGCELLSTPNFAVAQLRGKKKKKKSMADLDSRYNPAIQENALQKLYEENIMDRSHLDSRIFDELFDESLPVFKNVFIRLMSFDLQRVEAFEKFMAKRLTELRFEVTDVYPIPHRVLSMNNINNLNEKVTDVIEVPEYARIISMETLPAVTMPILMTLLKSTLPEGVKFTIDYSNDLLKWERYIDPLELHTNKILFSELISKK
ncbi:uncharacterized protein LOC142358588 isoform X1 [Convolutriloba macropyga]|uniref:uncharacterized protein LOC142358588 isoform X1 n=1 Tax=Convolutriloba macropyga TaxID=536237 RepID=UPI003F51E0F1